MTQVKLMTWHIWHIFMFNKRGTYLPHFLHTLQQNLRQTHILHWLMMSLLQLKPRVRYPLLIMSWSWDGLSILNGHCMCIYGSNQLCIDKTYRIAVDQIHSSHRGTVQSGILQLTVCFLIFSMRLAYQTLFFFTWFFQCILTCWTWRYETCLLGNILAFNWPDLAMTESFLFKSLRLCLLRGHFTLSRQSQNVKKVIGLKCQHNIHAIPGF